MNRQRMILFILVILFGIAVLWSYSVFPRPKTVDTLTFKPGQQAKPVAVKTDTSTRDADDGTKLKIGLLEKPPAGFKGYRRNIFKPLFVDEAVVVKPFVPFRPSPKVQASPIVPAIIAPAAPPLAHFTFMGFLKKGSAKTIFLAKDNEILLVKRGDVIAGRYEATDISDQALTLKTTDTGDIITIPLMENLPLTAAR